MHELLVVRHAIALDRLLGMEQGLDDSQRPLTGKGAARMGLAVKGLAKIQANCQLILSSPLLRAQQTADILHHQYPSATLSQLETLAPPYRSAELIDSLSKTRAERIAIVGHEPFLSTLIATLTCRHSSGNFELKKGGMALLRFDHKIAPGEGSLRWLMTPKQLRLLGRS